MVASCDNVPAVEEVTASDNCGDATVTVVETLFSGGCVGVIQRIFTATDECGNTAVHEQYITLVDTIAPVLANLPANATYECNVGAPAPANVTATDNCDSSVIVVFNETQEAGDCPQEYTIFRTWSAVDTCENAVSYTQVITITDNTAPTFNVENSEITVACDFVVDVVTPVATDNCDTTPTVTVASSSTPGECANEWTEMYTWTATDDCGNSSSVSLTINYVDEVAPVFTMVPQAINVECGQAVPVTAAMATDNCGDVTITYTDSNLLPDNCAGYYVRTFTAVDACGNSATATQNINIIDTTAPVITACPADASYSCLADVPAANTALVSATDVCSDVTIVLHSEVATGNDCQGTIVRTYRATDACGNFSNCVQVINYNDNVAPTFDNAPANMVASCDNVPAVADVTASDNCGDATVTVVETLFSGGCVGVIQRIFTATDECGNTAVHEQYITLVDTIAPVLANLPGDMEMECSDKMPFVPNVTATDNCDSSVNVIYSQTIQEGDCANNYTILRTWTATDTCNNSVSHTQVISVSDNTAPIIVAIPSFTLQGCNPEWPALATTWTDNCSEGGVVNGVAGQVVTNGCSQSRVYTFSVADECGNAASTTTTVTRTYDVTAPVIAAIADYTLQGCNPEWPSLTTTWTDNCSEGGSLTAAVGDVVTNGCSQSRVYTFNVIDACGNPATSSTTVTRTYDVVAPVITCPATVQVDCYDDVPAANVNSVSVSDACSSVTVTWEGDAEQGDSCEGTIIRTYRATDACGNFAECVQIINYSDNDAPVFVDAPADATYTCDDEIPALEDCIAVDNCSSNITYTSVEYIEGYTGEDGLRQCTLTTPFNVLGQPWAVWLPNSIGEPQYYYLSAEGGQFVELPNGRAHLTGTVYATNNPNKRWIIDVYFKDRADWTTWSGLGRSYKDDALVAGNLYQNWDYYIMNADSAVLVGDGLYAGANLALTHMPASYYFGFQVGEAANNRNAADGMSGWFFYSGTWNNSAVTGIGDFGFEKECPECDYTITRIWTATDECGNEATAVQVITVQPADTDLEGGITEQQIGRTAGVTLAAWPNPTAHKSTINFNVPFGGQVMLEVFNMDGKLIETLYRGEVMAGQDYYLPFNAESLSNGIYLYKLTTEKSTYIDKLMLAK
jgi:large repetitive protein